MEETRRNIQAGVKGYEAKLKKARKSNSPLNRSAKQSSSVRRRKKLTGKSDWYKKTSDMLNNIMFILSVVEQRFVNGKAMLIDSYLLMNLLWYTLYTQTKRVYTEN